MESTGILGGTFNPFHNGHMRLALEVKEALGLDRVLIMPCPDPPHKGKQGLLDFSLRVKLAHAALDGVQGLEVSTLEGTLPNPSYTWETLAQWRRLNHGNRPYFMMGAESFAALDKWYRGLELPYIATIVMVPRDGEEDFLFREVVMRFWQGSSLREKDVGGLHKRIAATLPSGGHCLYLKAPRLDISSTDVRKKWLEGKSLDGLLPPAEIAVLGAHKNTVDSVWKAGSISL